MAVLKGIAALYVMQADDRVALMIRQRELVAELVEALVAHAPASLERAFADDWDARPDDAARLRVVIDQVASLTDASAVTWHERVVRQGSGDPLGLAAVRPGRASATPPSSSATRWSTRRSRCRNRSRRSRCT